MVTVLRIGLSSGGKLLRLGYNKLNPVGVQSPTDDKKDAHGFGKEVCLLARARIRSASLAVRDFIWL